MAVTRQQTVYVIQMSVRSLIEFKLLTSLSFQFWAPLFKKRLPPEIYCKDIFLKVTFLNIIYNCQTMKCNKIYVIHVGLVTEIVIICMKREKVKTEESLGYLRNFVSVFFFFLKWYFTCRVCLKAFHQYCSLV